jgi:predicted transcriptional regulator
VLELRHKRANRFYVENNCIIAKKRYNKVLHNEKHNFKIHKKVGQPKKEKFQISAKPRRVHKCWVCEKKSKIGCPTFLSKNS